MRSTSRQIQDLLDKNENHEGKITDQSIKHALLLLAKKIEYIEEYGKFN